MCYTSLGIYESSLIFKRTLIKNVKIGQYWDVRQGLFKLTRDFDVCRAVPQNFQYCNFQKQ